jgi:hypothetical protein
VTAEGQQARPVALEQQLESGFVAGPDKEDQALVRLKPEEGCAASEQADARSL